MGHYEFGEHADVYTQLMFNDYESVAQIAPSGNFFDTTTINCDNPFLPVEQPGDIGCTPAANAAAATPCRCTSAGATWKAAVGSSRSRTTRSARLRRPRRDQRRLGLRRLGAVLERVRQASTLNYFVIERLERALRRRGRRRRADLPVRHRRHRHELRPLESVPAGRHHPGSARLPPGHGPADRAYQPGDLQRRGER